MKLVLSFNIRHINGKWGRNGCVIIDILCSSAGWSLARNGLWGESWLGSCRQKGLPAQLLNAGRPPLLWVLNLLFYLGYFEEGPSWVFSLLRHLNITLFLCSVLGLNMSVPFFPFLGLLDAVEKDETPERTEAGAAILYGCFFKLIFINLDEILLWVQDIGLNS